MKPKSLIKILVGMTLITGSLITLTLSAQDYLPDPGAEPPATNHGVCILFFNNVPAPPGGIQETFVSCYETTFPNAAACAAAGGTTRYIDPPHLPPQNALVTQGIWDPFNATCDEHREEYRIFVPWIQLLATLSDGALQAKAENGTVKLTLTTDSEDNVAQLLIYRSAEIAKGVFKVKEVCKMDSKGSKVAGHTYNSCTDSNVPAGTYSYWVASRDNNAAADDHYLNRAISVTVE